MPFNGSGGTSQPTSSLYPTVANTLIESAKANISFADIYTMLASCIVKDGQTTTTARIPFASGISTDTVNEKTTGTGVTLDSVLLKDGRIDTSQGTDIASAATVNLETATGNVVDVTGTTTITAVTLSQGHWRLVRFTGALTLTNGASLVLPGAADITTAAGDFALFVGYASSVVRCALYVRAAAPLAADYATSVSGTNTITASLGGLAAYATGMSVRFIPANSNTGATTINLNSIGAKSIFLNGAALVGYELRKNCPVQLLYDGTQFNLIAGAHGDGTPIGTSRPLTTSAVPSGHVLAYGQAISRTTYADLNALYSADSYPYGSGDGSTTFNVPDYRGRVIAGKDDMGGTSANRLTDQSGGLNGDTLGDTGGSETHTLTEAELPTITPTVSGSPSGALGSGPSPASSSNVGGGTVTLNSFGSDDPHNNVQPTIIQNWIIKV